MIIDVVLKHRDNAKFHYDLFVYMAKMSPAILCSFAEEYEKTKEPLEYVASIRQLLKYSKNSIESTIKAIQFLREYSKEHPNEFSDILNTQEIGYQNVLCLKNAKDIVEKIRDTMISKGELPPL